MFIEKTVRELHAWRAVARWSIKQLRRFDSRRVSSD